MKSDKIRIKVRSSALGNKWFTISRFLDYDVTIDMDTDVDQFSFTFDNPESIFSGLVSGYDRVKILIGDTGILSGIVDSVSYSWSDSDSSITISGRDRCSLLTDNDVIPFSKKNVKPKSYISDKCKKVSIEYVSKKNIGVVKKLESSAGESELSVIDRLLEKSHQKYWYIYDTLYTGNWNTGGKSSYRFTRGVSSNIGIPIKTLELTEDYSDVKSSVKIYSSSDDDKSKFVGSANLDIVKKRGFSKTMTRTKDTDTSKKQAINTADNDLEEAFRDAFGMTISVYNNGKVFMPNKICTVVDRYTGINNTFYIRAVRHYMDVESGSMSSLTLIPSKSTLKKLKSTGTIVTSLASTKRTVHNAKLNTVLNKYNKKWS